MKDITAGQLWLANQFADQIFVAELQRGISEVEKSFHYFRANRDRNLLLAMLCHRRKLHQPFAQNRNTADYHDRLLSVLSQFLHLHPTISDEDLLIIFGWAIRLAKYRDKTHSGTMSPSGGFASEVPYDPFLVQQTCGFIEQKYERKPVQPAALALPAVGAVFAGAVTAVAEDAVIVAIPGFGEDKAVGVLKADALPDGRTARYKAGNTARVEVTSLRTLKSGRVIVELKPAPRK